MTARDIRFGRRGGRWLAAGNPPPAAPPCRVCGKPVHVLSGSAPDVHRSCEEPEPADDDAQGSLL